MHQGERLRWLIDRSAKRRQDIAFEADISESSLYNYFKEETINSKKLKKLAAAIGVDISEFDDKNVPPLNNAGDSIMKMKISDTQKILLLREEIGLLQAELQMIKQLADVRLRRIESLEKILSDKKIS